MDSETQDLKRRS